MSNRNKTDSKSNSSLLTLSALGIVFGDIGASPLFTYEVVVEATGNIITPEIILGSLSVIIWTLIIITSFKYIHFVMRFHNEGEGGILALMSLVGVKLKKRPKIITLGVIGAAFVCGDGAITPAVSVLSALEGINLIAPEFNPYILPTSVAIIVALFAFQHKGTSKIGKAFGPIMLIWFLSIGSLGIWGISQYPSVLVAINPIYAIDYLLNNGTISLLVLGGAFHCVTGAEAMYADRGHFGIKPIQYAWYSVAFPCIVLSYAGQAAIVLKNGSISDNILYSLCPTEFLIPFIILATSATIIASQSIITGAFSMTLQAIRCGWMPPLTVIHTSKENEGEVYVGSVNWFLMIVTLAFILFFKKSDNLVHAYGIAISCTMVMTTLMLLIIMRQVWKWSIIKILALFGFFVIVDFIFLIANLIKISHGGYIPLILTAIIYFVMYVWHTGADALSANLQKQTLKIDEFMNLIKEKAIPIIPGRAIFLTRIDCDIPPVLNWHVSQNHALHEHLFIITVNTLTIPYVKSSERMSTKEIAPNIWRATANYGFMEKPTVPKLINTCNWDICNIDQKSPPYYVGHETIVPQTTKNSLQRLIVRMFSFMHRNAVHKAQYFGIPSDSIVEIGRQIEL